MTIGIYRIVHVESGKCYIGQSIKVENRLWHHFRRLLKGNHSSSHLQNAYSLHDADAFVTEVLEVCSQEVLTEREQFWMDFYRPTGLYNLAPAAGSTAGIRLSENHKKLIGESSKDRIVSLETRQKKSESMKGRTLSEETRRKISESLSGRNTKPFSEEHRKKLSESTKAWRARQKAEKEAIQ